MTNLPRILLGLLALLACTGVAAAQNAPCPECDADGEENPENSYWSADVGALDDRAGLLADSDAALAHEGDEKGFWSWLSLCVSAWIEGIENALGVDTGVDIDANAQAYVSEDGADLDATALGFDFDESELGHLDGMTWDVMADVNDARREHGLPERAPVGVPEGIEGAEADACLQGSLHVATCG